MQLTDKRFLGASSEPTVGFTPLPAALTSSLVFIFVIQIGVEFGSRLIPLEDGRKIKLQVGRLLSAEWLFH